MACFWKNERNAVEVCLREVGNYVYIGYESQDPEDSLVEVARDLSGYAKTGFIYVSEPYSQSSLYSKRRRIYDLHFNAETNPATATLWRDDGAPEFTKVAGVPTGLASIGKEVIYAAGKLRAVNTAAGFVASLYESDDGETWNMLSGSVSFDAPDAGHPGAYTVIGSRLVGVKNGVGSSSNPTIFYSDDGGATWTGGSGTNTGGSSSGVYPLVHSGPNIIALQAGNIYVSSDGAAWTRYTGASVPFFFEGPKIAANGTGRVVIAGQNNSTGDYAFARSSNHGNSWSLTTQVAGGIPNFSEVYALFWDAVAAQFVVFLERGDTGDYQVYTSPTGQNWTSGIVIPEIRRSPTQVID